MPLPIPHLVGGCRVGRAFTRCLGGGIERSRGQLVGKLVSWRGNVARVI